MPVTARGSGGLGAGACIPGGGVIAFLVRLLWAVIAKVYVYAISPFFGSKRLMFFEVKFMGTHARALLDSGASDCFISRRFASRLGLKGCPLVSPMVATYANGESSAISSCIPSAILRLAGRKIVVKLLIADISDDLILGQTFLRTYNPIINWREGRLTMLLSEGGSFSVLECPTGPKRQAPLNLVNTLLTKCQVKRLARRGCPVFAVSVRRIATLNGAASEPLHPLAPNWVRPVLDQFERVFKEPSGLPPVRPLVHTIPLQHGAPTPAQAAYRMSGPELLELRKMLSDLLEKGWISPSSSPYASPVLFVKKADGSLRMCVDYRQLNRYTTPNRYPLPSIDCLFEQLSGAQYFSKIDLFSGYHQIAIAEADRVKTAFITRYGLYQYNVMPFGLSGAPGTFSRLMMEIFRPLVDRGVVVYLDDVLIYSRTREEHLALLHQVFTILDQNKLFAKASKCIFGVSEVTFLGHVISHGQIRPMEDKLAAIKSWPVPSSINEVQQFLGLSNYYRRFIQNYSTIAHPLTELTKHTKSIKDWDDACTIAFNTLRDKLCTSPVLKLPDMQRPFFIHTDASDFAMGAVLQQYGDDGFLHPTEYFSRKFSPAERNYSVQDKELATIIAVAKKYRHLMDGATFFTDHESLTRFFKLKNLVGRQARWLETLQGLDITIQYVPGKTNVPADALSRRPDLRVATLRVDHVASVANFIRSQYQNEGVLSFTEGDTMTVPSPLQSSLIFVAHDACTTPTTQNVCSLISSAGFQWEDMQRDITYYVTQNARCNNVSVSSVSGDFLSRIREASRDPSFVSQMKRLPKGMADYVNGLYYKSGLVWIPNNQQLRLDIIEQAHIDSGHAGHRQTLDRLNRKVYWVGMSTDVSRFCKFCHSCQTNKHSTQVKPGLLHPMPVPTSKFQIIGMDFIVELPECDGMNCLLVVVDHLTKFCWAFPCKTNITAAQCADMLYEKLFSTHGLPSMIVSDRDTRFTSSFWEHLTSRLQVKLHRGTAHHPETDGAVERTNQLLEQLLRCASSSVGADWVQKLPSVLLSLNTNVSSSTKFSAAHLMFGYTPRSILDIEFPNARDNEPAAVTEMLDKMRSDLQDAQKNLAEAKADQKHFADKHRRDVPSFNNGDLVLLSSKHLRLSGPKKFWPRWVGPFPVEGMSGKLSYKLKLPEVYSRLHPVFHVSLLKPYHAADNSVAHVIPPLHLDDGTEQREVQAILDHKFVGKPRRLVFNIYWKGMPVSDATWEPVENLGGCDELLESYITLHNLQKFAYWH